eukprot:CAMPEP_0195521440 /NCGR_PEP_ID=MMETSP0794_2-20130614/18679_1 /TAXON_ID=515487 /ORGANISM="Stephanopyxis turris, Strain CCMP 815" /LENGTH=327 /DNA_ID=CAMNT_0040650995 /DNA_START=85 /DNA_END=1068 /DNA_ORIENTATION=+
MSLLMILTFFLSYIHKASASTSAPTSSSSDLRQSLRKWKMDQNNLYQLRSTLLSEALASRNNIGLPPHTLKSVSTIDGSNPEPVDWQCAISTASNPKPCLYSFDAPIGTKVVAPVGTEQWISLNALNRLRRMDPSKVEPMWHGKYLIQKSWFGESSTSLLQHIGIKGFFVSNCLLDHEKIVLRGLLSLGICVGLLVLLPLLEYLVNGLLCSKLFWGYYQSWARVAHAALPLKLLLSQMIWKFASKKFEGLEGLVKDRVVDMECHLLEEAVPVTVGEGSIYDDSEDEEHIEDEETEYVEQPEREETSEEFDHDFDVDDLDDESTSDDY